MSILRNPLKADLVNFQSSAGISVEEFLILVLLYLEDNVVPHNDSLWTQKERVFIGSCDAPLFAGVHIDYVGVDLMQASKKGVLFIGRHVHDILICATDKEGIFSIKHVLLGSSVELVFTSDEPISAVLQYLHLMFAVTKEFLEIGKMFPIATAFFAELPPKGDKEGGWDDFVVKCLPKVLLRRFRLGIEKRHVTPL